MATELSGDRRRFSLFELCQNGLHSLAIVLASMLAAVTYGVVHDQITARICIEYFTIGHPPVFTVPVTSPTVIGFVWGIIATWWVGLGLGIPLGIAARFGRHPKRDARSLLRPLAILMGITGTLALLCGVVGHVLASYGWVTLVEPIASRVAVGSHVGFITDWCAHTASYLFGIIGGMVLIFRTYRSRTALPQAKRLC